MFSLKLCVNVSSNKDDSLFSVTAERESVIMMRLSLTVVLIILAVGEYLKF